MANFEPYEIMSAKEYVTQLLNDEHGGGLIDGEDYFDSTAGTIIDQLVKRGVIIPEDFSRQL